jgi:multiple sugar transport system substrate-binding protein
MRGALAGAAAIAVGSSVAGCAATGSAAGLTTSANRTLLTFRSYFYPFTTPLSLVYDWTAPFRKQNPSIEIKVLPYYPECCDVSTNVSQISAGQAPDVMDVNTPTPYMEQGGFIPLDPLIKQSDVNMSLITSGQTVTHSRDGHLYGLPTSPGSVAYVANLGLIDHLGLAAPSSTWTYTEAAQLWQQIAKPVSGGQRYGADFFWAFTTRGPNACYLHGWGGSYVDPTDATKCALSDPKSIAAGNWLFGLIQNKIAAPGPLPWTDFVGGNVAFRSVGNWAMVNLAEQTYNNGIVWDLFPFPSWPEGSWTATNRDMFGIPVSSKHQKEAWEFLRWITFEPYYQQQLLRATLIAPVLKSLLEQWTSTLESVAPPLRGKNLSVFADPINTGRLTPDANFQYNNDGASQLIGNAMTNIINGTSVTEAFLSVAEQVNAFEKSYAKMSVTQRHQSETPPVQVAIPWNTPVQLLPNSTLAQTLIIPSAFTAVAAATPTWSSANSGCTLTLLQGGPTGTPVAHKTVTNVSDNAWTTLTLASAQPGGTYTLMLSKPTGTQIGWWLSSTSQIKGATAYSAGKTTAGTFSMEYYLAGIAGSGSSTSSSSARSSSSSSSG